MSNPDGTGRETRERLITSATGLFRRRGVAGSGISEICRLAGVTKGVFAHHFPEGKERLVAEVVRRNATDVTEQLSRLAGSTPRSSTSAISACFSGYGELLRAKGTDFGCPVAASVVDSTAESPAVRRAAHDAFTAWADLMSDLDPRLAELPDSDLVIVAALEGAILLARASDDPSVLHRIGHALSRLLECRPAPMDTAS